MADNTVIEATQSPGETIAADDVGGVKFQRVKLALGADGVHDGDVSADNPIPVQVKNLLDPIRVSLTAASPLNAYKVITTDATGKAIYADAANVNHANKVIGVAATAANTGDSILVQSSGLLSNTGWSWTPGQLLFVGLGGDITAAQVGAFSQAIGYAVTATSINVRVGRAILR